MSALNVSFANSLIVTSTRFATRYDALQTDRENHLIKFAQQKLLCGKSILRRNNGPGILACLSVRFALEFNSDSQSRNLAREQVERHMRLCLAATSGFERLVTISPSEPLLAEAARDLLQHTLIDPIDHLAQHSDLHCIDRGRRGELIAAFIIMQARDQAAKGKRWMSVPEFMEALLPSARYNALQSSMPTLWLEGEHKSFSETFEGYGMWFNHVIRVESFEMLSADNIWKFLTRGAMIVCADNQPAVDIVLPVCLVDQNLSRDTVTAIYVQVKNDLSYQRHIKQRLFHAINPFLLGLFSDFENSDSENAGPEDANLGFDSGNLGFDDENLGSEDMDLGSEDMDLGSEDGAPEGPNASIKRSEAPKHPIIRLVFALASQKNGVLLPNPRTRKRHHPDQFTAFDVWCAGFSRETFKHVGDNLESYRVLLDRSLHARDTFDLDEMSGTHRMDPDTKISRQDGRRKMAPLVYPPVDQ